jgi:hypothetical protein
MLRGFLERASGDQPGNECLTSNRSLPSLFASGQQLLDSQRAKVGRVASADFFVPQMGVTAWIAL